VSSDLTRFLEFLEDQQARQAPRFASIPVPKVLTYMGTTHVPGTHAAVSTHTVAAVDPGGGPRDLRLQLGGRLRRPPMAGECVTVHLTRLERYQGFQVKTRSLDGGAGLEDLVGRDGDLTVVKGTRIFTVHHSPYTLRFFDAVPLAEVRDLAAAVPFALAAVGPNANLSPRFVFHHEVRDGKVELFHGDGLALKTWMNLKVNRHETRVAVDLDSGRGWVLRGVTEEFAAAAHPVAFEKIGAGFAAGDWSRPSRCFRFVAEALEPLEPLA
jgi:hypothetical protein